MKKILLLSALFGISACSSGGGNAGQLCRDYITQYNALACVPANLRQDADSICANQTGTTNDAYYRCVTDALRCTTVAGQQTLDAQAIQACGTPASPSSGGGGNAGQLCRDYIAAFNALTCVPANLRQNADSICANQTGTTNDAYYRCVTDALRCTTVAGQQTLDAQAIQACGTPASP